MDRIAALRNVEAAISEFETGEIDLATAEERVVATLRTYATTFGDGDLAAFRVECADRQPVVVVADSPSGARERVRDLSDDARPVAVEQLD